MVKKRKDPEEMRAGSEEMRIDPEEIKTGSEESIIDVKEIKAGAEGMKTDAEKMKWIIPYNKPIKKSIAETDVYCAVPST